MYIAPVEWSESGDTVEISEKKYTDPKFNLSTYVKKKYDYVLCPDDERIIVKYEETGYQREWQMDGYCFLSHV